MKNKTVCFVCRISAIAVAFFIVAFIILLGATFDFSTWTGIDDYVASFRVQQMATVIPSLLLALSYVIFVGSMHIWAPERKKLWSLLALCFGLLYSGLSIANYFIQLVTVIPSILNGSTEEITVLVSGYPNSIFYALMASYFLMCFSLLFLSFLFDKRKGERAIRRLFQCNFMAIPLFLLGAIIKLDIIMYLGAAAWVIGSVGGPIGTALFLKGRDEN